LAVQQVRVLVNGTWHTLTYNGTTGKYEKSITAPTITSYNQSGGYYQLTVEATDDHGNVTTDSANAAARLTVKETTKPVVTITSPSSGAMLDSNTPAIVFTVTDESNGSGVNTSTVALKIDGGSTIGDGAAGMVRTAITNGYRYTYTLQSALSDGAHTITVNAADNDGNTATQKTVNFTVDTVPPALNVTAPVNSLKTNIAACNVTGTTNDATSSSVTVTVKLNGVDQGSVSIDGSGNFNKAITLAAGSNTIVVRSTDLAGKFTEVTRTVSLNTVAPVISNIAITPNPANAGDSILISCTVTDS
jgi:hypothetical protein